VTDAAQPKSNVRKILDTTGLDASFVLFTARRARSAGCADDLVAHLDWQRALVGYDIGEMDQAERRIRL